MSDHTAYSAAIQSCPTFLGVSFTSNFPTINVKASFDCKMASPVSPSANCMSNIRIALAATLRISITASFWPTQPYGPVPKGMKARLSMTVNGVKPNSDWGVQRSGAKIRGDEK